MYKKLKRNLKTIIPIYAILPLISCFAINCIIYFGTGRLTASWKHYDFTTSIDRMVPLVPSFVSIYLGCYIFWIANYIIIARQGKEYCMRFVTSDILSRLICGIFFLIIPTTNIRPELIEKTIWTTLLQHIYIVDSATNLFPSIHCLVSWFCYIGIRGKKNISKTYRIFSCIFALMVCISTQVIKQHYIIDVIAAIIIAEGTFYISFHIDLYKKLEKVFDKISDFIFKNRNFINGERE